MTDQWLLPTRYMKSYLGRLSGPIPQPLAKYAQVSPIGLVPKPHSEKYRLIFDLSSPRGRSVNDSISPLNSSLQSTMPLLS